jgi:hypothetical protein
VTARGDVDGAGDDVRLLAARSEIGYVREAALALHDGREVEPECVSVSFQRLLVRRSERERLLRRREAYVRAKSAIDGALVELQSALGADHRAERGLRSVRRSVEALGRVIVG